MRSDIRDRELGEVLDRLARSVKPEASPADVRRRGNRRRAFQLAVIGIAVAAFVGGVGYGALTWGEGAGPATERSWSSFGGPDAGWRIRFPPSWHLRVIDDRRCAATNIRTGAFISNVAFPLRHPDGSTTGTCNGGRWVFARFPRTAVALEVEPVGGMTGPLVSQPDTGFPLRPSDLRDSGGIRGGPRHTYLSIWRNGDLLMNVRLFLGEASSPHDKGRAATMLASLRLDIPGHHVPRLGNCPDASEVASHSSSFAEGRPLAGDIDGDGRADAASVVDVPGFPDACSRFVVVQRASGGRLAARLPEWWGPQLPRIGALARIDGVPGADVVATFDAGGFSLQVALLSVHEGRLVPWRLPEIFLVADAPREAANLDCAGGPGKSMIVWTTTGSRRGPTTDVLRRFYRLRGEVLQLVPSRTERLRVHSSDIGTARMRPLVPELADPNEMFPSCLVAR